MVDSGPRHATPRERAPVHWSMSGSQCVLDDAGRRCNLQSLESSGVPRESVELPRSSAGSHCHSAFRARISSAGLVVPNCMFRVALLECGTFVAGGHVPHKVEYHRACRGESTLQQEEEMYGVRQVLSATTAERCSQS